MNYTVNTITSNIPSNVIQPGAFAQFIVKDMASIFKMNDFTFAGDFIMTPLDNTDITNQQVYYDGFIGCHSFFQQFTTTFDLKQGGVESITKYPLYQKAKSQGTKFLYSHATNSKTQAEMKTGNHLLTQKVLQGLRNTDGSYVNAAHETKNKFTFKPDICINNTTSDFPSSFCGDIVIEFQLALAKNVFFGADAGNYTYRIENLTLTYRTYRIAKPINFKELTFKTCSWGTQNCSSNNVISIKSTTPMISAYSVFSDTRKENDLVSNKLDLLYYPEITQILFSLNSLQTYLNFPITTEEEILYQAIKAVNLGNFSESSFIYDYIKREGFAIGLLLPALTDTSQAPLQMLINSDSPELQYYQANWFAIGQRTV